MENENLKYERAKKRIAEEKSFYSHLSIYVVINIVLQLYYLGWLGDYDFLYYMPWWVRYTTPFFWGISLFVHWIWIFGGIRFFKGFKNWEARKIKQFMEEEGEEYDTRFRKNNHL